MNKRYQVFISSTYKDLIEERLEVMKSLLELNCIPCGMEYFPAANEDQWTFIKKLIDTCDYYVVIVGGCYGSEDQKGISYTEKEYAYALYKEIPTIGFIYHDRNSLPPEKKEVEEDKIKKLKDFIALVRSKLCKDWRNAYELGAVVSRSLTQLMETDPRIGWIRADKAGSEELLEEINKQRKEKDSLNEEITKLEAELSINIDTNNIAFKEDVVVNGTYEHYRYDTKRREGWTYETSWHELFLLISPYLLQWYHEESCQIQFASTILNKKGIGYNVYNESIDIDILQTIKVQFLALGLIQATAMKNVTGGTGFYWCLTQKGKSIMLQERSIKK